MMSPHSVPVGFSRSDEANRPFSASSMPEIWTAVPAESAMHPMHQTIINSVDQYLVMAPAVFAMVKAHEKFAGRDRRRIKREANKAYKAAIRNQEQPCGADVK